MRVIQAAEGNLHPPLWVPPDGREVSLTLKVSNHHGQTIDTTTSGNVPSATDFRPRFSFLFSVLRRNRSCELPLHDFEPVGHVLHALFAERTRPEQHYLAFLQREDVLLKFSCCWCLRSKIDSWSNDACRCASRSLLRN